MVNRTVWNPKGWKPGAGEEERPRPALPSLVLRLLICFRTVTWPLPLQRLLGAANFSSVLVHLHPHRKLSRPRHPPRRRGITAGVSQRRPNCQQHIRERAEQEAGPQRASLTGHDWRLKAVVNCLLLIADVESAVL